MKRKKRAAGAALTLLAAGLAAPASAEPPADPPEPAPAQLGEAVPTPAYSQYFVPFLTPVWSRLVQPAPLGEAQPLFQRYDTAAGMERRAQTSRVALTGFRTEVFAPVIEARVGDIVEVPISVRGGPPMTGIRVILEYDPDLLTPLGLEGTGIPTEVLNFNANPDPDELDYADRSVVALNVITVPWTSDGPVMLISFRGLKPGHSPLRASLSEISNTHFELVPTVFRSGLVRVTPQ